jgi:hypothetical protein
MNVRAGMVVIAIAAGWGGPADLKVGLYHPAPVDGTVSPANELPAQAEPAGSLVDLARDAERALDTDAEPFELRASLAARLQRAAETAPAAEDRGRFALLWLRSLRWLLAAIPFDAGRDTPPYRPWLAAHESTVVYSEPAGQWLVSPDLVRAVHDSHGSTRSGDDIAWFLVTNGYPGECEGYVPCYAHIMNWLDGEYLRRHPDGRRVSEAVARVRETLDTIRKMLADPPALDMLNPATDCGDLKAGFEPLRAAVLRSAADDRAAVSARIDALLRYCR